MYTPLYIKTDNSLQKSLIKIKDLVKFAKENNIKSLTITDDNMYGVMDFYHECINNDIKPIIGLEITIEDSVIVLYAENYDGYKNLIKLSTLSSESNLTLIDLENKSNDLVCIVPYNSYSLYNDLKQLFKDIYISYKNNEEKEQIKEENKIYMNETLYINKSDSRYIKYIDSIRESIPVVDIINTHIDNYILISDEYKEKYDIEKNKEIAELCNLEIPTKLDLTPKYINEEGIDSYTYLKKKCIVGLKYHFGTTVKEIYKTRLKYELEVINKMGFCDYFLIVSDYVNYAKDNNIIVGTGRGSAVGSLVSYCLKITDVDPIKYNLFFERFLNPERISMPDIDIDFEHDKRIDVINYCISKYGEKRVAPIITFGTLGCKQALRDVARSMEIEQDLIDKLCKMIDSSKSLKENLSNTKIKTLLDRFDILKECYGIAIKFEGLKRHTSIHAAGVIISNIDLDEVIPLVKNGDAYLTGYDMTYLEEIGLLKMDFLAIKYLTTIHNIIDSINETHNLNLKFDEIPLNDKKALSIFYNADTIGIFQFESDGMINFLRKLKTTSMEDLFAAIALFRPGPMQNIDSYIRRKNGKEKINYIDPSLEEVLKSTYGIIIYQEQIMQIARIMADYSLGEADILRKAMSKKKKDVLLKEEEKFTKRAINKGYDKTIVNKIYKLMLKFSEYGFNKSHSIGYSIIAYKMAYLKAHYPTNFMIYLLSMELNDPKKTKQYIYEAKKYGIKILSPDINRSEKKYKEEKLGIRYPLSNIKNVGTQGTDYIISERTKGDFIDIYDFIKRCYGKVITKKTIESLIYASCFDSFNYNKKTLIENMDNIINYGELIKDLDREYALEPVIEIKEEYTNKELLKQEFDTFGLYLNNNPITDIKNKYKNIVNINNIENYFDKLVNIVINIDRIKEIKTSKGDSMSFITGSDELAIIDIVLFPNEYKKYNNLSKDDICIIEGRVEKRFDKYQIVVKKLIKVK